MRKARMMRRPTGRLLGGADAAEEQRGGMPNTNWAKPTPDGLAAPTPMKRAPPAPPNMARGEQHRAAT